MMSTDTTFIGHITIPFSSRLEITGGPHCPLRGFRIIRGVRLVPSPDSGRSRALFCRDDMRSTVAIITFHAAVEGFRYAASFSPDNPLTIECVSARGCLQIWPSNSVDENDPPFPAALGPERESQSTKKPSRDHEGVDLVLPDVTSFNSMDHKGGDMTFRAGTGYTPDPERAAPTHGDFVFELGDNDEILRIKPDGSFLIRGELHTKNAELYAAFSEWIAAAVGRIEI